MKRFVFFLCLFVYKCSTAQYKLVSNADFIKEVSHFIVDSSFSHYYLSSNEAPCSFKRFDYDEWYKYALKEDVPLYILNELAKKSFLDAPALDWQKEKLAGAVCIDEEKAKSILTSGINQHTKSSYKSIQNSIVYYFSRPEFTDDYQYAVIDMGFRCDDHQCGMGATYLFRQSAGKWVLAGRKQAWGN